MGRMKNLIMDYVEFIHPGDFDKQEELFERIVNGETDITVDDMVLELNGHQVVDRNRKGNN